MAWYWIVLLCLGSFALGAIILPVTFPAAGI